MHAGNEYPVQRLSQLLLKEAQRLTGHDLDYAQDLVQEVWCKVFTRDDIGKDKMNEGYLIKVLRNHYYDQKRCKKAISEFPEKMEFPDENDPEMEIIAEKEQKKTEEWIKGIWRYLDEHKNGWLLKKQVKGHELKALAESSGINYNNLRKMRSRLISELKEKFKGGG